MKIVATGAKIIIKRANTTEVTRAVYFSDFNSHLQWTQKQLSNMFIIFTVHHHTVKNQKCQIYVVHDGKQPMSANKLFF